MEWLELEEKLLEFAKRVELFATRALEGVHRSSRAGAGAEFHSYVPYSVGEDTRWIDWKRYASSDRFLVQRFEKREQIRWSLFVDDSASMRVGDKTETSRLWAGTIAFLAQSWGDAWRIGESDRLSLGEAFEGLWKNQLGFSSPESMVIPSLKDSAAVVISDFYWPDETLLPFFEHIQAEAARVHFLQVVDPLEQNFPYSGVIQFADPETNQRLTLDSRLVKGRYLREFEEHTRKLKSVTHDPHHFHQFVAIPDELPHQLSEVIESL